MLEVVATVSSVLGKLRHTKTKDSPHGPTEANEKARPLVQPQISLLA